MLARKFQIQIQIRHRSSNISSNQLSKLASSNESFADKPDPNIHEKVALKLDPKEVFPWRHSQYPLNRLVPGTKEFLEQGGYIGPHLPPMSKPFRILAWINAAGFLGAKVLSYRSWKNDLEMAFMSAFALGVDGMLRDVYESHFVGGNTTNNLNENGKVEDSANDDSFAINFEHTINAEDDYNLHRAEEELASHEMLDSHLISLYRSAHTYGKHKLHITLRSRPTGAEIMSLFVLPFLTRKEVHDNVALKHSFRNILSAINEEELERGYPLSSFQLANITAEKLDEMAKNQMRRRGDKTMQMTIVAQVAVQCDEVFVVKDTDSDTIIQGDESQEFKSVIHLVRFEIVVDMNNQDGKAQIGQWIITDWDDLLDGNVFWT